MLRPTAFGLLIDYGEKTSEEGHLQLEYSGSNTVSVVMW